MSENGEKSKLIYFLLAILQAIVLTWSWRTEASIGKAKTDIVSLQAGYGYIAQELTEIKSILKERRK